MTFADLKGEEVKINMPPIKKKDLHIIMYMYIRLNTKHTYK